MVTNPSISPPLTFRRPKYDPTTKLLLRTYVPHKGKSIPEGRFFLLISQNKQYLGRDAPLGENKGFPLLRLRATIHLETADDIIQKKVGKKIGCIEGRDIQIGRTENECFKFSEVCKKASPEFAKMAKTLFDSTGWFKPELAKPYMQMQPYGDIFFIDTIDILPAYRGFGLGLLAVRSFLTHIFSSGLDVAIIPIPPSPPSKKTGKATKAISASPHAKLKDYWAYLGFDRWSTDTQDKANGVSYLGLATGETFHSSEKVTPYFFRGIYRDPDGSLGVGLGAFEKGNIKTFKCEEQSHFPDKAHDKEHDKPKSIKMLSRVNVEALLDGKQSFEAIAPVPPPKTFPKGYLSITLNKRKVYMGADQIRNDFPFEPVNAKIRYETNLKAEGPAPIVGKIDGIMIRREAFGPDKRKMRPMLAEYSQELGVFGEAFFDEHGDFMPWGFLSDVMVPNRQVYELGDVLYIKDIHLKKRYRGFNIGLLALWHLIKMIPSLEGDLTFLAFHKSTSPKLRKHFRKLGFGPWIMNQPRGDHYYLGVKEPSSNLGQLVPLAFTPRPKSDDIEEDDEQVTESDEELLEDGEPTEGEVILELSRQLVKRSQYEYIEMEDMVERIREIHILGSEGST